MVLPDSLYKGATASMKLFSPVKNMGIRWSKISSNRRMTRPDSSVLVVGIIGVASEQRGGDVVSRVRGSQLDENNFVITN